MEAKFSKDWMFAPAVAAMLVLILVLFSPVQPRVSQPRVEAPPRSSVGAGNLASPAIAAIAAAEAAPRTYRLPPVVITGKRPSAVPSLTSVIGGDPSGSSECRVSAIQRDGVWLGNAELVSAQQMSPISGPKTPI